MPDRPFVRVYHADMIRDYPDIWDDNDALATWLRLLVAADGSWPSPGELSRSVKARPLATLVAKKLVRLVGAHRFSIKGLDAERNARADAARNAAAKRWHSGSTPAANAKPMPIRAEPSHTEQKPYAGASDERFDAPELEALQWLARHGCDVRPGNGYHQKLVVAVEQHGVNAVVGMMDRLAGAGVKQGDIKGFLFGAIDALNDRSRPDSKALAQEERTAETAAQRQRAVERTIVLAHDSGYHIEADARCPKCVAVTA